MRVKILRGHLLALLAFFFSSCYGGGSSGTGTITVEGLARTQLNQPVPGVTIALVGTDEKTVSDKNGKFLLVADQLEEESKDIILEITIAGQKTSAAIPNVSTDASTIGISIVVDLRSNLITVGNVEVQGKIVGNCDYYFENFRTIRQANAVPPGTQCIAKAWIQSDGKPLVAPFILQTRSCAPDSNWETIGEGVTDDKVEPGTGEIVFQYYDDFSHCLYRLVTPYQYQDLPEIEHEILSFTFQAIVGSMDYKSNGLSGGVRTFLGV